MTSVGDRIESWGKMRKRPIKYVYTNGKRNEEDLSKEQFESVKKFAIALGMPEEQKYYNSYDCTAYGEVFDLLRIGTDVLPCKERRKNPNSNISAMAAIGHEIVGHREAALKGKTQSDDLLEEVQASIRAARFTPKLTFSERADLIRDALFRLNSNGYNIREVKHLLYINER